MIARLAARRLLLRNSYLALACAALLAAAPAPVRAQQAEIDALASRLAEQIAKPHLQRVVVQDLRGPDDKSRELGAWLADQLSMALARADKNLDVVDRAQVKQALKQQRPSASDRDDWELLAFLARSLGAEIAVMGSFGPSEDGVWVSLAASNVFGRQKTATVATGKIPMSKEMEALLGGPLQALRPTDGIFRPGRGGVGYPSCLVCPSPSYPEKARRKKVEGALVLEVIITPEGRATNITVKKSVGYGLDEKAVEAVRGWRFKPATGPEDKPLPVRSTIEITFRLLKN